MPTISEGRSLVRNDLWEELLNVQSDQRRGVPAPPLQKPCPQGAATIALPDVRKLKLGQIELSKAIWRRHSHRRYTSDPLTLEELSFLLWATQGVREAPAREAFALRTVPSAGARHPLETYIWVSRVIGLTSALYRYLPLQHRLCLLGSDPEFGYKLIAACHGQPFVASAAVTFIWTAIPYRTEWRYSVASPKLILLDAGHVCQNLYLACEGIDAGTCAIGAYHQDQMDALLDVDGEEEFVVYLAPVGKV